MSTTQRTKPTPSRIHPITHEDIEGARYVCDGALSPNGALAAYVLSETVGAVNRRKQASGIWLVHTSGGKPRRLTRGGNDSSPVFSPDSKNIYFLSARDKVAQIYRIAIDGGEAEPVTNLAQGAGLFRISGNGNYLAFAATSDDHNTGNEDIHIHTDRAWYRFDPFNGYLADINQAVYLLRLDVPGAEPEAITEHDAMITALAFAPQGNRIAFTRIGCRQHEFMESDLYLVEFDHRLRATQTRLLNNATVNDLVFSGDGKEVWYTGNKSLADQTDLWRIDIEDGKPRNRTRRLDWMVGSGLQIHNPARPSTRLLATSDDHACVAVTRGGQVHIHDISMRGRLSAKPLTHGERVCHLLDIAAGKLLFTSQDMTHPPELHLLSLDNSAETQLSHHNDRWRESFRWPVRERLLVRNNGAEIEGWVLKPRHVRAPYKTILYIHGGPHAGFGESFNYDFHELAGAGYAVAFANPRGSTGYGNDFSRSIIGCWGEPEFRDFTAFMNALVKRGISHPEKLGVTGISGGGHLSAWLIGHTNRFKAAVPEQGVYNLMSFWGTSDAGRALMELEMGAPLHKMPMTYWKYSPMAYAHKCKTPTLLIQGENDVRCPIEQAEQFYTALKSQGCVAEFIRLQKCNHGAQLSGRPSLRRYRINKLLNWFNTYIK